MNRFLRREGGCLRLLDALKKKKTEKFPEDAPQNAYYEEISAGLGIFQVILYAVLLAFVVLSFASNTNLITYQNFYYFFKDLNASAETVDVLANDFVTYPTGSEQSFTLYRKGLAVASNRSVTIFTATGRQTVSTTVNYQNPVAVGTGKYLLVYELGGLQYSLYNSYTQIYSAKSEYPIYNAAVSSGGTYALLTASEEYTSVVSLYSSRFSLIGRYSKSGYVMDLRISERGDRLAILTSSAQNGLFRTVAECFEIGKEEPVYASEIDATLAYSCAFTSTGMLGVLSNEGVYYVAKDGQVTKVYELRGSDISHATANRDGITICLQAKSTLDENTVVVFDKNGKIVYNESLQANVLEIAGCGDSVYFLTPDAIHCINVRSKQIARVDIQGDGMSLLAVDEQTALVCSPQKASYIRFDS